MTYRIEDFLEVKASFAGRFTHDGAHVIYLSNATGMNQLYMVPRDGGESVQLTKFDDPVSRFTVSPTQPLVVCAKATGGDENMQLYLIDLQSGAVRELTNSPRVRYDLSSFSYDGTSFAYASNERNGTDFDVYVYSLAEERATMVFSLGGWCSAGAFSPLGTYLAIHRSYSNVNADVYLLNLREGSYVHITEHEGDAQYGSMLWLPDESAYYLTTDEGAEFFHLTRGLGSTRSIVLSPEWDIEHAAMDRAGQRLALTINEEGYCSSVLYDARTLEKLPIEFPKGNVTSIRFSMDGKYATFNRGDSTHTTDVWVVDCTTGASRQLTKSFQGVPPEILVEPALVRFTSFDGLSVPAFVYRPKNTTGATMPTIISIHGGPEAQYLPDLALLTQFYVYSGYMVVAPNVRGSSGYGKSYLALDNIEKRLDSLKDIVALRDYLIREQLADETRIALSGGSYGGFMVLAGLAFYPKLWAAGIDIVGIVNFVTFMQNTAPYRRKLREAEYGSLENDRELLEHISPISKMSAIEAPLFVIHGKNDPRVPLSEAEQVVESLKSRGREVEFLVYDDEGHGLAKLKNRLDAYPKVVAFLDRVLKK